jgi:hypothetical protein
LVESVVRGLWLLNSASDDQVARFRNGKLDLSFGQLTSAIELSVGDEKEVLSNFKSRSWSFMNDLTHTGSAHIARRINVEELKVSYPESELVASLAVAGAFGLVAAAQLAVLAGQQDLARNVLERLRIYVARNNAKSSEASEQ